MDFKLSKENIIKVFVAALVLIFMLEAFAIAPRFQSPLSQQPVEQPSADRVVGTAVVTASIYSFSSELLVEGGSSALAQEISALRSSGKILYTNPVGANSSYLNLAPGVDPADVYPQLQKAGGVVSAEAIASLPSSAQFTTMSGAQNATIPSAVSFTSFAFLQKGDNVSIRLTAMIEKGAVLQLGAPVIVPQELDASMAGEVKSFSDQGLARVKVLWENRQWNISKAPALLAPDIPGAVVSGYSYFPAIGVRKTFDDAQMARLRNLSFVNQVIQEGVVGVQENFTDTELATREILAAIGETDASLLLFPEADLNISFSYPADGNSTQLEALFTQRLNASRTFIYRKALVSLLDTAQAANGDSYSLIPKNVTIYVNAEKVPGDLVVLTLKSKAVSNKIISVQGD